ncbi:unnamed protein product [Ectocarpus sp. 4 AP-2014]
MKIFQALILAAVAVLQVDAETCSANWETTCSDETTTVATTETACTGADTACTEDDCCLCPDGYTDSDESATVTCAIDDTKCLSHTCTVDGEIQISAAATTDCTDGTCTDAQCCIADPCAVDNVCGDYQDCTVADDDTASCTCTDGYVDDGDENTATLTCELDDTKCLSHTCTVDDEIQISAAATTDCTDGTCTDAQCCEAGPCAVDNVCGDYQDCTVADDDTASCTCTDGYVDDGDENTATLTCELDDTKCLSHTCTVDDEVLIDDAATTDCTDGTCTDAQCCEAETPALSTFSIEFCGVEPLLLTSITTPKLWNDAKARNVPRRVHCVVPVARFDNGDGDEDMCSTEQAACEANTACAACMTAGEAYMEDETTCVVESEPESCQDFADMYCCFAGGADGEEECRTDSLMLAYTNCLIGENEVESCTLIDLCDTSATVGPTPAPVTSGSSSFFLRSSPGAAVFGAVATGIAGFLFTAAEGLL